MIQLIKNSLLCIGILLLISCRGDEPKRMPDTLPDILGHITSITQTGTDGNKLTVQLLVEAKPGTKTAYPKASIRVDDDSLIEDETGKRIKAGQLREGQEVEVWFEDEVMESFPVQATAKAMRVQLKP